MTPRPSVEATSLREYLQVFKSEVRCTPHQLGLGLPDISCWHYAQEHIFWQDSIGK